MTVENVDNRYGWQRKTRFTDSLLKLAKCSVNVFAKC